MNRFLRPLLLLLCSATILVSQKSRGQLVSSEIFLQGDYVEIGIAQNGAFGTDNDAPTGYHPRGVGLKLGFVADPDKDGWTVGTPNYIGDYYLPGSPQEGWDIEYNGTWAQAWRGSGGTSFTGGLTGTCTGYSTTATYKEGTWQGSLGAMSIKAVTKLKNDKVYFLTKVTIKNTGATTLYNVYYNRTVDPDNEVATPGGGSFTTDNKIVYAIPSTDNKSLVTAIGVSSIKAYLGLASKDCRAKPYIITNSLTPQDSLNKLHSGNGVNAIFKVDSLFTQDVGIGIVFKIDSIKAGDSTQLSYAYILREADLDSAFEDLKPEFLIADKPYISNDTARACAGATLPIDIVNGDYFDWTWSPATGLSTTKGSKVTLTVGSTPITYTATVTNPLCYTPELKITVVPIPPPAPPAVAGPIYYCQNEPAIPLTATPASPSVLRWYYTRTGGSPLPSLTPFTNVVGSRYYYVSQIRDSLCESFRDSILVITRALPKLDSLTYTNPTYCAATDGTITFRTDSANKDYTLTYDKDGVPVTLSFTSNALRKYTITGLGGGSYAAFVITNKFGCKSKPVYGPLLLVDPVPPGPPLTNNGPLCVGDTVRLTAAFVDATATYRWTGPDGFSSSSQNPVFVSTPNSGGEYSLIATVGPCNYKPSKTTLVITPTPKHQVFISPLSICEGSDLNVDILREALSITYLWSGNGVSLINQGLTIPNVQQGSSGAYVLTAESDNGCITKDTINVLVDQRVRFTPPNDTAICSVDSASLVVLSNVSTVLWSPTKGLSDSVGRAVKARPDSTVTYGLVAKSGNSCPDTSGKTTVTVIAAPKVLGYDTVVRMNVPYTVLPVFGQGVVRYKWTPSDSLSCDNCPNPVFNSNRMMVYKVEGINKEGCIGTALIKIDVFCDGANVTMPNAFTPNGDGNNDVFYVRGTGFTVKSFSIYNRNGQVVFNKENFIPNDPKYGWDGTFGGQPVSDVAGFVYMMEIVCANSKNAPELIKGTLLMIK
jgi:gliding motility-associated-like protein